MTEPASWTGSARSRTLACVLGGASVLGFISLIVFELGHDDPTVGSHLARGLLTTVMFAVLGTVLALRQPANPMGWLLTAGSLAELSNRVAGDVAMYSQQGGASTPMAARVAAGFTDKSWPIWILCSVGLPLLLFPTGRTRSRRWQLVLRTMLVGAVLTLGAGLLSTTPIPNPLPLAAPLTNPFGVEQLARGTTRIVTFGSSLMIVTSLTAAVGIVVHFRSVAGVERQQLRWVRIGALLALAGNLTVPVGARLGWPSEISAVLQSLGSGCLPLSITVAILRYRLYDLDRIVSRTVTYGAVTGLLVATYVGLVTAASRLTPSSSSLGVAASTLAVAALFQPVRRRVQHAVDRRFNRARIDSEHIVDGFRRRLREQVDLDVVRAELVAVASRAVQPASAALWLRGAEAGPS